MVVGIRANDERSDQEVVGAALVDVLAGLRDRHLHLVGKRTLDVARLVDDRGALRLRVAQQPCALQLVKIPSRNIAAYPSVIDFMVSP